MKEVPSCHSHRPEVVSTISEEDGDDYNGYSKQFHASESEGAGKAVQETLTALKKNAIPHLEERHQKRLAILFTDACVR